MMKQIVGALAVMLALTLTASAQTPAGPEFRVNTYTISSQLIARSAMEPDGDFVVAWVSYTQDGSGLGVFGQRFAASGAPRGNEFRINTYTTGVQGNPSVTVGGSGDFVVVWQSVQGGAGLTVQGQRYDTAGNPVGAEFPVNTFMTFILWPPKVGLAADGRFVVSWPSYGIDGSFYGIAARRFDASGNPIGADFVVNTFTGGNQFYSDLAVEANGNFVVVWEDQGFVSGLANIFGQRYDTGGNRLGSEFQVNSYTTGGHQRWPSVSVSPAGDFVVVWSSDGGDGSGYGLFARRFDASGNGVGSEFVVNTYTTNDQWGFRYGFSEHVAHDASGNFTVTWISTGQDGSSYGIFAQRFSASGARRGAEFQVNTFTTGRQTLPSVSSDAAGNFVVVWTSYYQDGSAQGIFAQRFGGLAPAALAVDSAGNRVLEPGETVDVRPSWRNTNTVAQTFSGALSVFTGPPGATYTITDAAGDYGTVPSEGQQECTDCYGVSISNPTSRPAVHWDASVVEGLAAPTPGQQKQWVLHVGRSFRDVSTTSPFYPSIETLLHNGITAGCTYGARNTYCPAAPVTREQMAPFLLLAKEGAGYLPAPCQVPMFADVPATSSFCRWIEELARRGLVAGCGGGNYCPTLSVSREAMAVFLLRTLDPAMNPPDCSPPNIYPDVPETSPFCRWIEELANRGVFADCGGGNYCPTGDVSREQMSEFISVPFGLTLYGP